MIENFKAALDKLENLVEKKITILIISGYVFLIIFYNVLNLIIYSTPPTKKAFILTLIITVLFIIFLLAVKTYYVKRFREGSRELRNEIKFIDLIRDHTSEIILLLNNYGQIINHNTTLSRALNISHDKLKGKPLRDLFNLTSIESQFHYKDLVLDKLKNAFQGRESELISTIQLIESGDIQTIHLKLTPILINNELESIYVSGRLLQSDYITNKWLSNENCTYEVTNDITLIHLFSHRLARNLDGKIPRSEILHIQIALQEVLINAIEHGNLEIDFKKKTELKQKGGNYYELLIEESSKEHIKKRRVYVDYSLTPRKVIYRITDDGKGFNWKEFIDGESSYFVESILTTYHGIGLQMVKKSFDEINFNEKGNEITLVKYIDS